MAWPIQTERFIRFQLEQLASRNEHHTFEEISFQVAERRLSRNLLRATGPVGAGGDQGRDAETFQSRLPEESLVIAASVRKAGLEAKIRADLQAICARGRPVSRVAFFAAHPIAVAARHRLQAFAHTRYGVGLEIFDGDAIAHLLSQDDLIWVAQRYLDTLGGPAPSAIRVRDMRLREFGVHQAIDIAGTTTEMPAYVRRDADDAPNGVRARLEHARDGGFVLLVGGSSVGKTRTLVEAVQAVLPDWWVIQPRDAAHLAALAEEPIAKLVIWLDELQRYLRDFDAATARALIDAGAILVGTVWPTHYDPYTASPEEVDPHSRERELLKLADIVSVPAAFSTDELGRARDAGDPRLAIALESTDFGVTQTLAGAPHLVARWNHAGPYAKAVLSAAVDYARLGVESGLSPDLLRAAAPAYCTANQRATAPADWFEQAISYTTQLLHGSTSALIPVGTGMARVDAYRVADYLLQYAAIERRPCCPPPEFWEAAADHHPVHADLERLGMQARSRLRYRHALPLFLRAAENHRLFLANLQAGRMLLDQGRHAEAIERLKSFVDSEPDMDATVIAMLARCVGKAELEYFAGEPMTDAQFKFHVDFAHHVVSADRNDVLIAINLAKMVTAYGVMDQVAKDEEIYGPPIDILLVHRAWLDEMITSAGFDRDIDDWEALVQKAGRLAKARRMPEALELLRPHLDAGLPYIADWFNWLWPRYSGSVTGFPGVD